MQTGSRLFRSLVVFGLCSVLMAICSIPAGASYDLIKLNTHDVQNNTDISFNDYPDLNNVGQVVWKGKQVGYYQVWLYSSSDGTTTDITNNQDSGVQLYPQINDNGKIIWELEQEGSYKIQSYVDGTITTIGTSDGTDLQPKLCANGWIFYDDGTNIYINEYNMASDSIVATDWTVGVLDVSFLSFDSYSINSSGQYVWVGKHYITDIGYCEDVFLGRYIITDNKDPDTAYADPYINKSGEVVFVESVAEWSESGDYYCNENICLYDGSSIKNITNISGESTLYSPKISDDGEVFWLQYEATAGHYDLYGYDGLIYEIASKVENYSINDNGEVVYEEYYGDIYLYNHGTSALIGDDGYDPQINNQGECVWRGFSTDNDYIYYYKSSTSAVTYSRYDFNCYYNTGNGDYYTGYVYAATDYNGYKVGYTQAFTDENGETGYYEITSATSVSDGSQAGQVYVTSYYDKEADKTYTPVSNGTAVGSGYLGSEYDYIIKSGVSDYYFGAGYYEADVTATISRYDFYYFFGDGSGDWYYGYLYAPTNSGLTTGTCIYLQPEAFWASGYYSLEGGYYYISAVTGGYPSSYDKQCYITYYYDGSSAAYLGVNSDGSATWSMVYVSDRSASWESGYATNGASFSVYKTAAAANAAASSRAVWAAYWSQSSHLLEEEK